MDREERKTINQGQEDEMVNSFYSLLVKCELISAVYSGEAEKYIKKQLSQLFSNSVFLNWDYVTSLLVLV